MSPKIIEQLAPKGVLRVAINLSNFLLVTDRSAEGNPVGVSPDMASEVARDDLEWESNTLSIQTPEKLPTTQE